MQDDGSLFYLSHNFNGKSNSNGSIFTIDKRPFNTDITTIYGHNMQNKLMFSELVNYYNQDFLKSNKNFKIYTKSANYLASIIDVYSDKIDNQIIINPDKKEEYFKNSNKIVKLITCDYGNLDIYKTNKRCNIIASLKQIE